MKYYLLAAFAAVLLFPAFVPPTDLTEEALGEKLFFDPILSEDRSISCASCHIPAFGFADTSAVSKGVGGRLGRRNTQGITNMTSRSHFFFDGRAGSLEQQVLMPIQDTVEMRLPLEEAVRRLRSDKYYAGAFKKVYGQKPDAGKLAAALAAYVRTLETGDSPFDRWARGKANPMSEAAVRGRRVFMDKGKCFDCHFSPDFTGDEFRNIGLFTGSGTLNDVGRFALTRDSADLGKFKTPGLRNVAVTAPYMHNGMFKTLEEVIDYYDQPDQFVKTSINRDSLLRQPLGLSAAEKADLKAFLEALTDDRFVQ
ncbi:MAG: cytochrome-c peroxidase [Chitinophagales bacterium]|nr:cytochrome-c peroxidase [Chitinophagales bacterium]